MCCWVLLYLQTASAGVERRVTIVSVAPLQQLARRIHAAALRFRSRCVVLEAVRLRACCLTGARFLPGVVRVALHDAGRVCGVACDTPPRPGGHPLQRCLWFVCFRPCLSVVLAVCLRLCRRCAAVPAGRGVRVCCRAELRICAGVGCLAAVLVPLHSAGTGECCRAQALAPSQLTYCCGVAA